MSTLLQNQSDRERRVAAALRERVVDEINRRGGPAKVVEALQLMAPAIETLCWRNEWSLETAFRLADALGLDAADEIERAASQNGHRVG